MSPPPNVALHLTWELKEAAAAPPLRLTFPRT